MDGSDSNHSNMKTKNECDKGVLVDRISELPDEIIYIILSLLPLREAASTSILSHRWSDSWKHSSNLDFVDTKTTKIRHNSWHAETCHHVKTVNSVLESHQTLFLKQFRISFYVNKSAQSIVTKWLEFAQSRQVEILDLNFHRMSKTRAVVLEDLVREMRPMKYLKTLCLAGMKVSGEDISYFLKNCPLLRELTITYSSLTSDVYVSGDLEILRIYGCILRKFVINISAPQLYNVIFDAKPGQLRFKNVPSLAMAGLVIGSLRYNMANFASTRSCFTSHLQKLSLLVYPMFLLGEGFPHMPNINELRIIVPEKYVHQHHCLVSITSIISACPCLQKFKFEFEFSSKATPDVETCPHQRLKMIKFQGLCATNIIKLMTYISVCCEAYQEINPCSPYMSNNEVQVHMDHMQQLKAHLSL